MLRTRATCRWKLDWTPARPFKAWMVGCSEAVAHKCLRPTGDITVGSKGPRTVPQASLAVFGSS